VEAEGESRRAISYKIIQKLCMAAHVRSDLEQAGSAPLWLDPYTFCLSRSVRGLLNENQSNCAQDFLCASGRQQRELRAGNALSASPPVIENDADIRRQSRRRARDLCRSRVKGAGCSPAPQVAVGLLGQPAETGRRGSENLLQRQQGWTYSEPP